MRSSIFLSISYLCEILLKIYNVENPFINNAGYLITIIIFIFFVMDIYELKNKK